MTTFNNIKEVIPYILDKALAGFEIVHLEGYGGIEEITSKISQSSEKIIVNLKGYPTNTCFNDGDVMLAVAYDIWIKSDSDYTSLLMLVKQAIIDEGGRCGISLNGAGYKIFVVYEDASPVRTNSGLWLNIKVMIYV